MGSPVTIINLNNKKRTNKAIDRLPTSPEKQSAFVLKLKIKNSSTDSNPNTIKSLSTNDKD